MTTGYMSRVLLDDDLADRYLNMISRRDSIHQIMGAQDEDLPGYRLFTFGINTAALAVMTVVFGMVAWTLADTIYASGILFMVAVIAVSTWAVHTVMVPNIIDQWANRQRQTAVNALDDLEADMDTFCRDLIVSTDTAPYGDLVVGMKAVKKMVLNRDWRRYEDPVWTARAELQMVRTEDLDPVDNLYMVTAGGLDRRAVLSHVPGEGVWLNIGS